MNLFEKIFRETLSNLASEPGFIDNLWSEIEVAYSSRGRHYHNLSHLEHLATELAPLRESLKSWRALVLALAYHDFIYSAIQKDNEEQSARIAWERCTKLHLPEAEKKFCNELVLTTKNHAKSQNETVNYFTDADLSILGAPPGVYENYTQAIRKEYAVYPDFLYKPGRKKVLTHFSARPTIFKTSFFRNKYEEQARKNITNELRKL